MPKRASLYIRRNRKESWQNNNVAKLPTKKNRKERTTKTNKEQPKKKEKDYTRLTFVSLACSSLTCHLGECKGRGRSALAPASIHSFASSRMEMTKSCLLGVISLKTTSFLVFHSRQMVSKISDLTPFCRVGLAPAVKILICSGHAT
jgi:hypothetical protein